MKNKFLLASAIVLSAAAHCAAAMPPETGFYAGAEYGVSSLNNDAYIYDSANNARQPELNVKQSNDADSRAAGAYAGYNFFSGKTEVLGAARLQLGLQFGYTDMGSYKVNVHYFEANSSITGYRKAEENAADMLLVSTLYWENGLNLFLKAGVARLHGKYTQEGLRDARQPEFYPTEESITYNAIRPELGFGAGVMLTRHIGLHAQYSVILGGVPSDDASRFEVEDMTQMPNKLYRADRFTAGVTLYF